MFVIAQAQTVEITQPTVIAILVSSAVVVVALLALIGYFASKTPANQEGGPLHYGNFFVVSLGIITALIGFMVAFPLVVSGVFEDPTQVIALLSALFGTIVGLVGTYLVSSRAATQARERKAMQARERKIWLGRPFPRGIPKRTTQGATGGILRNRRGKTTKLRAPTPARGSGGWHHGCDGKDRSALARAGGRRLACPST